jgi:hypothetical protein
MRKNLHHAALFVACLAVTTLAAAPQPKNKSAEAKGLAELQKNYVVPSGTRIPLVLKNTINTRTAYVGQSIYCETIYPITAGNRIVIPVGSYVRGKVTQVVRPGRFKGKAQLGLRFDSITLRDGITQPLRATLSAFGGAGNEGFNRKESKVKGVSSKGKDAGRVATATVTGAEIGTLAGIGAHHSLEGLGIGSLAGAGAGAIWVMATRGKEIVLRPGTNLELDLSAPLTFAPTDIDR